MSSSIRSASLFIVLLAVALQPATARAIVLGQIDDFQDLTTQGWMSGALNPNPPTNVANQGPAGLGDDALLITSSGILGPGSNLTAFNLSQWTGDYLTEGVEIITADVNNVGTVGLTVRVALDGVGGRFASTIGAPVAVGSGWQTVVLPVGAADLTAVGGLDVNGTLGGVSQMRLISASAPSFMGDTIVAQLLVDNVVAVPAPSASILLAACIAGLGGLARQRMARPTQMRGANAPSI